MPVTEAQVSDAVVSAAPALLPEFVALDACHQEVLVTLQLSSRLVEHLDNQGVDAAARQMAAQVVEFFSTKARQHHAEEEQVVFPPLLTGDNAELVHHVQRLQQDHGWLEEDWLVLAPQLQAVAEGYSWYELDALRAGLNVFTELYLDHIDLEESLIYPEAKRVLSQRAQAGTGRQLSQERRAAQAS
ncbi:MAG: hemerythrin domain-containing protein [Leptothrix sp. (in: b-proteobacteria)]